MSDQPKKRRKKIAHRCPFDTFDKIRPLIEGIEHYLAIHCEDTAVLQFSHTPQQVQMREARGLPVIDTYLVKQKYDREKFRELAEHLHDLRRGVKAIAELKRMLALPTPEQKPASTDQNQD